MLSGVCDAQPAVNSIAVSGLVLGPDPPIVTSITVVRTPAAREDALRGMEVVRPIPPYISR